MKGCVWKVSPEDRLCKYCRLTACPDRVLKSKRWGSVTASIRGLEVGGSVRLDHGYYGAARTASSRLAEDLCARYIVRNAQEGVIVERIA